MQTEPDFIQQQMNAADGVQLQTTIKLCKKFLEEARKNNGFLESDPVITVILRLRDCAIAECLRREINFVI